MNNDSLFKMRHSAEHVLMQAMKNLGYKFHMAMGPAIDEGFYFDFQLLDGNISEENFPKIESEMERIIKLDLPIIQKEVSPDEARNLFKDNPYKQEWIDEIVLQGSPITVYWTGKSDKKDSFVDLCKGPHIESTGKIGAVKLLSIAGAYWHGDEKNIMLTRIYGTAFETKGELEEYLHRLEEAKRRDHKKIGKELELFVFSDLVGKGLPMLTPKGTVIRKELESFVLKEETKWGYSHVVTPPLAKIDLYKTSGHYPYYKETMYPIMKVDDEELILRPMTCPHHFMLYKSKPHSYKELPIRLAEISPQFRYEKSGELSGLTRVRMFCLADAHIICSKEQAKQEIKNVLNLIDEMNKTLGFEKGRNYRYRLSLGDRKDEKKYYKDDEAWNNAENSLREVLVEIKAPFFEAQGEAAFYGPKIDIQMKKVNGQEETAFTVQYDFVMPKRFELSYTNSDRKEEQPIVIHRSSIGAFERTMAFLIEHFAGAFPVWLAPVQVEVISVSDKSNVYAREISNVLRTSDIRISFNDADETVGNKIRKAQEQKIPYMLIIGEKESDTQTISVRDRNGKQENGIALETFTNRLKANIMARSLEV